MTKFFRLFLLTAAILLSLSSTLLSQAPPPASPKLKDEMRMPWQRSDEDFLRLWLVAGPFPGGLNTECLGAQTARGAVQPTDGLEVKRSDGALVKWHSQKAWDDVIHFDDLPGPKEDAIACAFLKVTRPAAGKALLSIGSGDGIRVWLNGKLVLSKDDVRSLTPDEDQVEVDMKAGENALLVKVAATRPFCARVLEPGSVFARTYEIGPSIIKLLPDGFTLKTDIGAERSNVEPVKIEVIQPGGKVIFTANAPRGALLPISAKLWPDGPYDVRFSTHTAAGLLYATYLPWYKGDSMAKARELAATAAKADASKPEGFTLKMLSDMVDDRLGSKLIEPNDDPWQKIHSPLMEYEEMMLERKGQTGRIRPGGFVRLAYRDEVDGSPQFCRAYLPEGYDPARKWPLVIQIHGYNGENPVYVRWWAASDRHVKIDTEYSNHQGVIYMEPHGRGNTQYIGMGDSDVLHALAEAKRLFNVDDDRVYLTGDSMGGWGTWNVSTRHPDLFAAIAPVFGGSDYHAELSEDDLAKLIPMDRFLHEKGSSWAMADGLLNIPIFVHHGDADQSVKVDYSRWGVRLLQRWGYNVRYHEYPGRIHEALLHDGNANLSIEWFLQYRRDSNPLHVRIRSAELRNASAYWAQVLQEENPRAFMVVDAEVVDRNVIRLDTQNVLDIVLSPSAALVDPSKPIKVVWNGAAQEMPFQNGKLRLTSPNYKPSALHKTGRLPGSMLDFTVTPFAIVIGTASKDPEMVEMCRQKAKALIDTWRDWQKQEPRAFQDTELKDADMARYSFLLIGGPEANRVTAKFAAKLPLQISADHITIDGKEFPVKDAALQMIYPNPLNPDRYVWLVAGTSTDGMYFNELNIQRPYDWDYVITDGHIPAYKQSASPLQIRVVSGMFDYNWRFSESLTQFGDSQIRSSGRLLHRPKAGFSVDQKVLDSYVGHYQIEHGPSLELFKDGKRLMAKQAGQNDSDELLPESDTDFNVPKYNVRISFVRDSSGKVTGFTGYQNGDFEARKLD